MIKIRGLLFIVVSLSMIVLTSCEKKQETKPEQQNEADQPAKEVVPEQKVEEPKVEIPDLTGTWTGKFDKRATTLKITEQDSTQFKGKISINYREQINQEISGSIDIKTKSIVMKDLLHSRYMGTYKADLSEDYKKFTGVFTMNLDGTKFNFNLSKK